MADESLSKWPLFSLLEEPFLRSLKLVLVFGSSGNEAVVVTQDDQVYALGSNTNGCLGLGDTKASFHPRRVKELCNKGVSDMVYGSGPHVIAMTTTGVLYSWGHDCYGQLGLGAVINSSQGTTPRQIEGPLSRVKVTQVACGGQHSLALTSIGQVFAWGYNNCGQIGTGLAGHNAGQQQVVPRKVDGILSQVVCSSVCCSNASSVALSETGELYCWGYNGNGQLGVGSNINHHSPCKINLSTAIIKQVACGYAHVLALSDKGELYAWGSNMHGQLGTGTKDNSLVPMRIAKELGSMVQVASYHNNHLSGVCLLTGKVYMWGLCRGQSVLSPLLTKFPSLDDLFAAFGAPMSMWRALIPSCEETRGLVRCIAERFDDVSTSDLSIVVEGRKIHVHKAILRMRCEYFHSMFQQGRWTEADKNSLEVCHFPYPVYYGFLKYLYTDKLDNLTTEETLGLLELADSYCEKELKKHCERLIWQTVTVDNVATLMTLASKYRTSNLEDQCMSFALSHMTQVIQSDSFDQLDSTLAKTFIKKAADKGAFKT